MKTAESVLLAFVLASCGDADDSPAPNETAFDTVFSVVGRTPLHVSIDNPIGQVGAIEPLTNGIAVADLMASDVKVFDARGYLLRTLGGPGDGPGEMRGPFAMAALHGDTLIVLDQRGRLTVFDPDGALVSAWQAPVRPVFGMVIEGGALLIAGSATPDGRIPESASRYEVHRFSRNGDYLGSLVDREAPVAPAEASFMGTPIALHGSRLTIGRFGRNEIRHYDLASGKTSQSTAGSSIFRTPAWSQATGRTMEDAIRFAEPYAWLERIFALDCGLHVVVFQRSVNKRRDFQYVLHGGTDFFTTPRTEVEIGGARGRSMYATSMDQDGNTSLLELAIRPDLFRCND